jgi:hypothetical protein
LQARTLHLEHLGKGEVIRPHCRQAALISLHFAPAPPGAGTPRRRPGPRRSRRTGRGKPACGALAQLGEHLLCKQRVIGSIPIGSTKAAALERLARGGDRGVAPPLGLRALRTCLKPLRWSSLSGVAGPAWRGLRACMLRHPRACALGICLKKVHRTFLPRRRGRHMGSIAQVVRAHA